MALGRWLIHSSAEVAKYVVSGSSTWVGGVIAEVEAHIVTSTIILCFGRFSTTQPHRCKVIIHRGKWISLLSWWLALGRILLHGISGSQGRHEFVARVRGRCLSLWLLRLRLLHLAKEIICCWRLLTRLGSSSLRFGLLRLAHATHHIKRI